MTSQCAKEKGKMRIVCYLATENPGLRIRHVSESEIDRNRSASLRSTKLPILFLSLAGMPFWTGYQLALAVPQRAR